MANHRTIRSHRAGRAFASLVLAAGLFAAVPTAARAQAPLFDTDASLSNLEHGNTKPKEEPKLSFLKPGVVSKMNVKEGDRISKGQILAEQDDREEQAELQTAEGKIIAADLQIGASVAQAELAKVMLKRKQEVYSELVARGGTNSELDQAMVEVKVGEATVNYHTQMREQAKLEMAAVNVRIAQKKLLSPIDGFVAKIEVQVGEGTDLSRPAMQVVQNDVLKVEVPVMVTKARQLKLGQTLQVRYMDEEKWMPATVTFMTPYADASSGTRMIRLEMPNESGREAGVPVYVKLPENLAAAK